MPKRNETYWRRKAAGVCYWCGGKRAPGSVLCRTHKKAHRDDARAAMRAKRAADPAYRALEKAAVRERMRKLRAKRHRKGLNNAGEPFVSDTARKISKTQRLK